MMVKLDKKNREAYKKNMLNALHDKDKDTFREKFLGLHPSDQSDIFIGLDSQARKTVYHYITPEEIDEVFKNLEESEQKLFYLELDESYSLAMFNDMLTDNEVIYLNAINNDRAENILNYMDKEKAQKVRSLLSYAPETAGAIMTKELISISSTACVGDVLEMLRQEAPDAEIIYYLYVVNEEGLLAGVVSLRDLIIAAPDEKIADVM